LADKVQARADQPTERVVKKPNATTAPLRPGSDESTKSGGASAGRTQPPLSVPAISDSSAFSQSQNQAATRAPRPPEYAYGRAEARIAEQPAAGKEAAAELQSATKATEEQAQVAAKRDAELLALRSQAALQQERKAGQQTEPAGARPVEADEKAEEAGLKKKAALAATTAPEMAKSKDQMVGALRHRANESAAPFATVSVAKTQILWRVGPAGSIERSDDAGGAWQSQASGVASDLLAGSAPSTSVCWVVGRGGVVLRTTDGKTWAQMGSPSSQDLIAVEARDAEQATVTTSDGKRYATSDGGRTWRSL